MIHESEERPPEDQRRCRKDFFVKTVNKRHDALRVPRKSIGALWRATVVWKSSITKRYRGGYYLLPAAQLGKKVREVDDTGTIQSCLVIFATSPNSFYNRQR